jgi:hypothetical protein
MNVLRESLKIRQKSVQLFPSLGMVSQLHRQLRLLPDTYQRNEDMAFLWQGVLANSTPQPKQFFASFCDIFSTYQPVHTTFQAFGKKVKRSICLKK